MRAQPLWRQLEQRLAAEIISGELKPGQRLPSALDLAQQLGVNRHTLRRALAELERRGLLRTEPGHGSFVRETCVDYPVSRRTRFSQNMRQLAVDGGNQVLAAARVIPTARVAEVLALRRNEAAWRVESAAQADGRVVDHSEAWFPHARFPHLDEVFTRTGSVTRTLAEFGIDDYLRRFTRVSAQLPDARTASVLQQPAQRPVLLVESLNVDLDGRPVQYGLTRFAGERVQLVLATE